jgi:hypothetical protein
MVSAIIGGRDSRSKLHEKPKRWKKPAGKFWGQNKLAIESNQLFNFLGFFALTPCHGSGG